jgi:hypothetical protein
LSCDDTRTTINNNLTTIDNENTTETSTSAYASPYISYQTSNIPVSNDSGTYFYAEFTEPIYYPLIHKICFNLTIEDDNYKGFFYYLVTKDKDDNMADSTSMFSLKSNNFYSYSCLDYSNGKEIFIAKSDICSNTSIELEQMATLSANDTMSAKRKDIESHSITNNTLEVIFDDEIPYFDLSFEANDPERLLSKLVVQVYYTPFQLIYDEIAINITNDMYEGDRLKINDIIFNNLSPNTDFNISYYLSGNDGVENFYNIQCGSRNYKTPTYLRNEFFAEDITPGFWGLIKGFETGETITRFSFIYFNNSHIYIDNEPASASLKILDTDDNLVASYPLTDGMTYVDIDNQYLGVDYTAKIVCDQNDSVLYYSPIRYRLINLINVSYSAHTMDIVYYGTNVQMLNTNIIVYDKVTQQCVFDFDIDVNDLEIGHNYFDYPDGPNGELSNYEVTYIYTYIGFDGEENYTWSFTYN